MTWAQLSASANLLLWLSADSGTYQDTGLSVPAAADGDPVGGWADRSGHGKNATQAVAINRPTLQLNSLNGLPGILLNNGLFWLSTTQALTPPYTLAVVGKDVALLSSGGLLNGAPGAQLDGYEVQIRSKVVSTYQPAAGKPHLFVLSVTAAGATVLVDGMDWTTSYGQSASFPPIYVGNLGRISNCVVCEIIAYDNVLGTVDLISLSQYLDRWAWRAPVPGYPPTGVVDPSQAPYYGNVQAAVNALPASGGTVRLPAGTYQLPRPLMLQTGASSIEGSARKENTVLTPGVPWHGPLTVVLPKGKNIPLAPALLSGAGQALSLSHTNLGYLNPRDVATCALDGLPQFCLEMAFMPTAVGADGGVIQSSGKVTSGGATSAGIWQQSNGSVRGRLTVGGVLRDMVSPAGFLVSGVSVYLALTYDGSAARLFGGPVGGTCQVLASVAATGTVSHPIEEDWSVGQILADWPENDKTTGSADGVLDSVRFSKVARYTAAFTAPAAKLTIDSNTLLLVNWDSFLGDGGIVNSTGGPCVIGTVGGSATPAYLFYRSGVYNSSVPGCAIKSLALRGSFNTISHGALIQYADRFEFEDVQILACNSGVLFKSQCYLNRNRGIKAIGGGGKTVSGQTLSRYGLAERNASSGGNRTDPEVSGHAYNLILSGGMLSNFYTTTGANTVVHLWAFSSGGGFAEMVVTGINVDDEPGTPPNGMSCVILAAGQDSLLCLGGDIQLVSPTNSCVAVRVVGGRSIRFANVGFYLGTQVSQVFLSSPAPALPVDYTGSVQTLNQVPWGA